MIGHPKGSLKRYSLTAGTGNSVISNFDTMKFIRRVKKNIHDYCCSLEPSPIIVMGNQKSGTTVIAALLAKAAGKSSMLDFFFREPLSIRNILDEKSTLKDFIKSNKSYFSKQIIKDPDLTFLYPEVRRLYPNSNILFILRDPIENVRSILNRVHLPGKLNMLSAAKSYELNNSLPEWYDIIDGTRYGHHETNPVLSLLRRAILSHNICNRYRADVTIVRYEDFLINKKLFIENLCNLMGLNVVQNVGRYVDVQYQPKGVDSKNLVSFFGEKNIEMMLDVLQGVDVAHCLKRNGYAIPDCKYK